MKLLATLVCALAVMAFAAPALAQDDVTWVTYYDELQNVMWSQPADASREAVLAYHNGDLETAKGLGLDCNVYWPTPEYLKISPSVGTVHTHDDFNLLSSGPYLQMWEAVSWGAYVDPDFVDNYVDGRLYNRTDYCTGYSGAVYDEPGDYWDYDPDVETCTGSSPYYYRTYHSSTVDEWEYPDLTTTPVTGHIFYACGATRNVVLKLTIIEPEK